MKVTRQRIYSTISNRSSPSGFQGKQKEKNSATKTLLAFNRATKTSTANTKTSTHSTQAKAHGFSINGKNTHTHTHAHSINTHTQPHTHTHTHFHSGQAHTSLPNSAHTHAHLTKPFYKAHHKRRLSCRLSTPTNSGSCPPRSSRLYA